MLASSMEFLNKKKCSVFIAIRYAGEITIHCTFCKIMCDPICFQISKTQFSPHGNNQQMQHPIVQIIF